jgi:hypothetical protein
MKGIFMNIHLIVVIGLMVLSSCKQSSSTMQNQSSDLNPRPSLAIHKAQENNEFTAMVAIPQALTSEKNPSFCVTVNPNPAAPFELPKKGENANDRLEEKCLLIKDVKLKDGEKIYYVKDQSLAQACWVKVTIDNKEFKFKLGKPI